MEALQPVLRFRAPFLTRSIVHIAGDWRCPPTRAAERIGWVPEVPWRDAVAETVQEHAARGFPWPSLNQAVSS